MRHTEPSTRAGRWCAFLCAPGRRRCHSVAAHRVLSTIAWRHSWTRPGALVVHRGGTPAGCTNDDDDGCRGREMQHEGDPIACTDWFDGCNYCGVH
jgi:hypothetical protein